MAAKLGSTDVSFRLGATTPAAVYLGSEQVWSAATVPGAPTGLTEYNNAGLYWNAPADDGGSAITGYKVYVTGTHAFLPETYSDTDVTDMGDFVADESDERYVLNDEGVTGDVQWYSTGVYGFALIWRVSAVSAAGEGPKSDALTATIV